MKWSYSFDVIVVGAGFAGVRAAIAAHDAGSKVIILEKMSHPGGISVMSSGAMLFVQDKKSAREYFTHLSGGRVSAEMISAFVEGLSHNLSDVKNLAKINGASFMIRNRPGLYPFPGREGLNSLIVNNVPGFNEFSWYPAIKNYNGARLMAVLLDNMSFRKIKMNCSTTVQRIIQNKNNQIIGLEGETNGKKAYIKAKKAIILACGGFEFDEWTKLQHLEASPFYGIGSLSSTGDGIRLAQSLGARIWHMWQTHNSYGFKYDGFQMAFRNSIAGNMLSAGKNTRVPRVPWIIVDTLGKRFMNELPFYPQDTGARPLYQYDSYLPGFPGIPCYLIFDENGRKIRPIADPIGFPEHFPNGKRYKWSADNNKEIENGWILKADSLEELAYKIKSMPNNRKRFEFSILDETVKRWNSAVIKGNDREYLRHAESLVPVKAPPFYAMEAWPVITNTQGGPEHNRHRQVLDAEGKPIPRLYTAGELGSFFGNIYEGSGNIGECFSSGRISGAAAAVEDTIE